jgi:hypothetical protein
VAYTLKNAYRFSGAYRLHLQDMSLKTEKPAKAGSKLAYQTYHQFISYSNACYMHSIFQAVKPLSIVPLCTAYLQTFKFLLPVNRTQKQSVITLEALFLKASFSHVSCSEFYFLTHGIRSVINGGGGGTEVKCIL